MNTDNSNVSQPNTPRKRHGCLVWLIGGYFFFLVAMYLLLSGLFLFHGKPLPSDEKMIAHFQAHRAEFETLAKNYKAFIPTVGKAVFKILPENKEMIKNAAIRYVSEYGVPWFPNPYSPEAAKQFAVLEKKSGKNVYNFLRPYTNIEFSMENQPLGISNRPEILFWAGIQQIFKFNKYSLWDFILLPYVFIHKVSKTYVYIPAIPKIEDGLLQYPVTSTGNPIIKGERVLSSLTYYPFFWKNGECVYRQLEPHWFIKMCNQ